MIQKIPRVPTEHISIFRDDIRLHSWINKYLLTLTKGTLFLSSWTARLVFVTEFKNI